MIGPNVGRNAINIKKVILMMEDGAMIKIDLPMPDNCVNCTFSRYEGYVEWGCVVSGRYLDITLPHRPETCPLIESEEDMYVQMPKV